jgi:hypothetical protein
MANNRFLVVTEFEFHAFNPPLLDYPLSPSPQRHSFRVHVLGSGRVVTIPPALGTRGRNPRGVHRHGAGYASPSTDSVRAGGIKCLRLSCPIATVVVGRTSRGRASTRLVRAQFRAGRSVHRSDCGFGLNLFRETPQRQAPERCRTRVPTPQAADPLYRPGRFRL